MFFRPIDPPACKAIITYNDGLTEQAPCVMQVKSDLYFQPLLATTALIINKFEILDWDNERIGYSNCTLCMISGDIFVICRKPWRREIIVGNGKGKSREFDSFVALKNTDRRWAQRAYRTLVKHGDKIIGPGWYDFTVEYRYKTFTLKVGVI